MNWEECGLLDALWICLCSRLGPTGFPTVVIGLVSLTKLVHGCEDRAGVGNA